VVLGRRNNSLISWFFIFSSLFILSPSRNRCSHFTLSTRGLVCHFLFANVIIVFLVRPHYLKKGLAPLHCYKILKYLFHFFRSEISPGSFPLKVLLFGIRAPSCLFFFFGLRPRARGKMDKPTLFSSLRPNCPTFAPSLDYSFFANR